MSKKKTAYDDDTEGTPEVVTTEETKMHPRDDRHPNDCEGCEKPESK
jgi:hypothetical protein